MADPTASAPSPSSPSTPAVDPAAAPARHLLVFTKPAVPGRVKTRLAVGVGAERAARLHGAFLEDLVERLRPGAFALTAAWALEPGEEVPAALPGGLPMAGVRQRGADLGERLRNALAEAAEAGAGAVAAVGSDHPLLTRETVLEAFDAVEAGADLALGPSDDGGYYLIALRGALLTGSPEDRRRARSLFEGIPWSTGEVHGETVARARAAGLSLHALPGGFDVDRPEDLRRLAGVLAAGTEGDEGGPPVPPCPRTEALLAEWGELQEARLREAAHPETELAGGRP